MRFPNFKGKHAKDSMLNPKEYIKYRKRVGKFLKIKHPFAVILCYDDSLIEYILKNHRTTKVESYYHNMYLLNETEGKIAILGNFGIGAPAVVTLFEELIALGVKRFITIGIAGTLQKNICIGDLIICDRAIRDEGTSYHYLKPSKYSYASKDMTKSIRKALEKAKLKYVIGTSWTIDAPYRETISEAKQYQKEGVITVEMEAAALFAVAEYRNVDIGAIFTISDSLAELEWKPKFHLKKTKKGLETIYTVALDTLLNH